MSQGPLSSDKYMADWKDDTGHKHSGHRLGLNVLFTDGHVEFVKYGSKAPVTIEGQHPRALVTQLGIWSYIMGGWG